MKTWKEQLWALNNVQQRTRKVRQTNGLQEFLPNEYRSAFGLRNFESGNFFYKGSKSLVTTWNILGPMSGTPWNIRTGMNGGLATAQSRENSILKHDTNEWSVSFVNAAKFETDMPTSRFGVTTDAFQRLRWRGSWQRRQTQGWSARTISTWHQWAKHEWKCDVRERDSFPEWWTTHQP